jgi:hypothetical protein
MATKADPVFGPNNGFIMFEPARKGRGGVVRAGVQLIGADFYRPNFAFKIADEAQLPDYLSTRVDYTVKKVMHAVAQCYAEGVNHPRFLVEGARLQYGRGRSRRQDRDGKSYLWGTQAGHFGIGTVTRQGQAVSKEGLQLLRRIAKERGASLEDIATELRSMSELVSRGMVLDGDTCIQSACLNQGDGQVEPFEQKALRTIMPNYIPSRIEQVQTLMIETGARVIDIVPLAAKKGIRDFLAEVLRNPAVEILQDPHDVHNLQFKGIGSNYLEAQTSCLDSCVNKPAQAIPTYAEGLAELAEAARGELASTTGTGSATAEES